jgi:hypothetical protein
VANFSSLLRNEQLRRDAALMRMREACSASKWTVQRETEGAKRDLTQLKTQLKHDYSPHEIVARNPWVSVLSALAVGFGLSATIKYLTTSSRRRQERAFANGSAQRVVVQVEGAKPQPAKSAHSSGWKQILDAAMHGIPAVIAFAEQHFSQPSRQKRENGAAVQDEEPEHIATAPGASATTETPFKASISRRSAPPPRES